MTKHVLSGLLLAGTVAASEYCTPGVDIVFLQDTTESFETFLTVVSQSMPNVAKDILDIFPDSRFGVAEFRDKTYWPHGFRDDFCYRQRVALTTDVEEMRKGYAALFSSGGADVKEGHYFGIINLIYDETMGWSNDGRPKLIVMSTDARPHMNNDYLTDRHRSTEGYEQWGPFNFFPEYMPPYPGRPVNVENVTEDCAIYDHPSWEDMQAAVLDNNFYLASFIPNADSGVISDWTWVNDEALGQDAGFLNYVTMEGAGFSEAVINALRAVGVKDCEAKSTMPPEVVDTTVIDIATTSETPTTTVAVTTTSEIVTSELDTDPTRKPEGELDPTPPPTVGKCTASCDCYKCMTLSSYARVVGATGKLTVTARY